MRTMVRRRPVRQSAFHLPISGRRVGAVGLFALLLVQPSAAWQSLNGNARLAGAITEAELGDTRSVDQQYMLNFNRSLLSAFQARASLSYHDLQTWQNFSDNTWHGELQPSGDLAWVSLFFTLGGNYRYRQVRDFLQTNNSLNRGAGVYFKTSFVRFPQSAVQYDWDRMDNPSGFIPINTEERRFLYSATYSLRNSNLYYSFTQRKFANLTTASTQRQKQQIFRFDTAQSFWKKKLRFSTNYLFNYTRNEETAANVSTPLAQVTLLQGLYAEDLTPEFGALDSLAGLMDGNLTAPTAPEINIGGASTQRNIGFDLGTAWQISLIYLYTDQFSSEAVSWTVYTSSDNLQWTPLPEASTSVFNLGFDRYEITFAPTAARYFKVVNSGVNSEPEVFVTEIQALFSGAQAQNPPDKSENHRVNVNTSYQMRRNLRLAVDGVFGSLYENATNQTRQDLSLASTVTYQPTRILNTVARYQRSRTDYESSLSSDQETELTSLVFLLNPLQTLELSLSGSHTASYQNSIQQQRLYSSLLHASARLIPGLSLVSEVGYSLDHRPTTDQTTDTWNYRLSTDANPYRNLNLTAGYSLSFYSSNQPLSVERRDAVELRYNYRITSALFFHGGLTYGREGDYESSSHDYALSWNMTERLASNLSVRFQDSGGGQRVESWNGQANYTISPRSNAYFAYSYNLLQDPTAQKTVAYQLGLNTSF